MNVYLFIPTCMEPYEFETGPIFSTYEGAARWIAKHRGGLGSWQVSEQILDPDVCGRCNGKGNIPPTPPRLYRTCPDCRGTGHLYECE